MKPPLFGEEGPMSQYPRTEWRWHLDYITDGDDFHLPPCGVIEETQHEHGQLAVWWREPIREIRDEDEVADDG